MNPDDSDILRAEIQLLRLDLAAEKKKVSDERSYSHELRKNYEATIDRIYRESYRSTGGSPTPP
jgi:hypothetical protein